MLKPSSSVGLAGGLGESSATVETLLFRGGIVWAGWVGVSRRDAWDLEALRRRWAHN